MKVFVFDVKKATVLTEYVPEAAGKIVHAVNEADLKKLSLAEALALHNNNVDKEEVLPKDTPEAKVHEELFALLSANTKLMQAVPKEPKGDNPRAAVANNRTKGASARKAAAEAGGKKGKAKRAPGAGRPPLFPPEAKIKVVKKGTPFTRESARSKIFDKIMSSKTVGEVSSYCETLRKKEKLEANRPAWDISNAIELGYVKVA